MRGSVACCFERPEQLQKEKEYIEKVTRPKFIRYCKVYTDIKKAHARELRTTGYIKYNKVDDQSTKA